MLTLPASLFSAESSILSGLPAIVLSEVKRPWPSGCAAADREPVDRGEHLILDAARLEHGDGAVSERDDADLDRAWLLLDEGAGGSLGGLDPGRLEVLGVHAVRDVEGKDHGALTLRHGKVDGRSRQRRTRRGRSRRRRARTGCGAAAGAGSRSSARGLRTPAAPPAGRAAAEPPRMRARAAARPRGEAASTVSRTTSAPPRFRDSTIRTRAGTRSSSVETS